MNVSDLPAQSTQPGQAAATQPKAHACRHDHAETPPPQRHAPPRVRASSGASSVLGWPAWQRVLAVLPLLLLMWLAVLWAADGTALW